MAVKTNSPDERDGSFLIELVSLSAWSVRCGGAFLDYMEYHSVLGVELVNKPSKEIQAMNSWSSKSEGGASIL